MARGELGDGRRRISCTIPAAAWPIFASGSDVSDKALLAAGRHIGRRPQPGVAAQRVSSAAGGAQRGEEAGQRPAEGGIVAQEAQLGLVDVGDEVALGDGRLEAARIEPGRLAVAGGGLGRAAPGEVEQGDSRLDLWLL